MVRAGFWSSKSLLSDVEARDYEEARCSLFSDTSCKFLDTNRSVYSKGISWVQQKPPHAVVLESGPRSNTQHG